MTPPKHAALFSTVSYEPAPRDFNPGRVVEVVYVLEPNKQLEELFVIVP